MSKLKECSACGKEVATSAKVCPHCGKKLKSGLFVKFLLGLVIIGILSAIFGPSTEEKAQQLSDTLDKITNAQVSNISASGKLNELFSMMSKNTDIQRDNMEEEMKGKIVQWILPVYEVEKLDENKYKIQTSSGQKVGAFVTVHARTAEEASYIESLVTGNMISFKGKIDGTFMRNIEINPAILVSR